MYTYVPAQNSHLLQSSAYADVYIICVAVTISISIHHVLLLTAVPLLCVSSHRPTKYTKVEFSH